MKVPVKIVTKPMISSWAYENKDIQIPIQYKINFKEKRFIVEALKECSTTDGGASFTIYYKVAEGNTLEEAVKKFMDELKKDENIKDIKFIDIDENCIKIS